MPDILRVTLPTTGQENINKLRPNMQQQPTIIPNVPDPSKVNGTNNPNVNAQKQNDPFAKTFSSNFDKFLQMLKSITNFSQEFSDLTFTRLTSLISSGISENFANEISEFLNSLTMTKDDLLGFIKGQAQTNTKFSGPIFEALKQILQQTKSPDVKQSVLEFLRVYDSYTSSDHVMKTILNNLNNIKNSIPRQYSATLEQIINKLEAPLQSTANMPETLNSNNQLGANIKNLNIIKSELFPFLSAYIGNTKDFSQTRDIITILTLNFVKYELGTKDNLNNTFNKLLGYTDVAQAFKTFDKGQIEDMLNNNKFNHQNTKLMDKLSSVIQSGLKGEAGYQTKEVFENILNGLLVNKSVYMPVSHMIIPANIDGNMFFSEIWIDPNDTSSDTESDPLTPATKILIKFDIKDIGFFELILLCKNKKVDMQLYFPEKYKDKQNLIRSSITKIIENNGLSFNFFGLDKTDSPVTINEVFPKLYEKKDTINVVI